MNRRPLAAVAAALVAIGALGIVFAGQQPGDADAEPEGLSIGLMSSLPIYRASQQSVADALAAGDGEQQHWLRSVLEQKNRLDPVDLIDPASLAQTDILLLVQPRALTPAENVALDDWVRGGGRVLLVADPMLTSEPRFVLGDPRNPQAIAVTGPIEARWGLSLQSGTDGDGQERTVEIGGHSVPVVLGGRFAKVPPAGGDPADCALSGEGLLADCAIGAGRAVLLADATLFERDAAPDRATDVLWYLLGMTGDAAAR